MCSVQEIDIPHWSMPALVRFGDLLPSYVYGEDILVAFDYAEGLVVSSDDWIGLFPAKWTRPEQFIAYKKAPPLLRHERKGGSFLYTLVFHTYSLQALSWQKYGSAYPFQFAFVSHAFNAVLGVSSLFRVETIECTFTLSTLFPYTSMTDHPLVSEKDSLSGHHYRRTMASMTTLNLSSSSPASLMRNSACFQPSYASHLPSLLDLELQFRRLELQNQLDVWNISSRDDRSGRIEIDGQIERAEIKKRPISDPATMNGNFYPRSPVDFLQNRRPASRRDFIEGTPKDPSIDDHPSDHPINELLLSQHENQNSQDQYGQGLKNQHEQQNLSDLASMTHRLTISDHSYLSRVRQMEREQLRWMQRLDELRFMLARCQAENDQLRASIQRFSDERMQMMADFKRLELHNEALCKEYQRQRVHLQDLYFTLSLHGFDYVVLPDGRKQATFHQQVPPDVLALEQSRQWPYCNERTAIMANYRQHSNEVSIQNSVTHQVKNSIMQPCEQLMRKLADLQQQRDHIDGYIDWLKAEARKKEHIYDDPFTDDVHPSDEDFEQLDNQPMVTSRQTSGHQMHDTPANAPNSNMGTPRNIQGLQTANQTQPHDQSFHSKSTNQHDQVNQSVANGNDDRRQSGHSSEPTPGHHGHDRRESLSVARSRFMRKDSLLAMLLDTAGGGVLSKPRRSIFSRQKPQHNAFITGRGYGMHGGDVGSPKTVKKIRTHII